MDIKLFDSELKVMDVLWKEGDGTAKHISEVLKQEVGWNVNTTYTLIKRCIKKGAIERSEPNFMCHALIPKEEVQEAETNELRISIVHESVAVSGRSICIRKSLPKVRHTVESILDTGYCSIEVLSLLINCVKAKMNFAFCGEPGVGKTECAKFFSRFIPPEQRAITIEDNLEMHFHEINPENDCVELQVSKDLSYTDAIKLCLRQNPKWIILSEARSTEVQYLLEQWSTGVYGFTTLHLDDLRNLPDRIMNMIGRSRDADRLENYIYEFISVGVLIRQCENEQGMLERYIDQMCFYDRFSGKNEIYMLVEDGRQISDVIPSDILKRMRRAGIQEPFHCPETCAYEPLDIGLIQSFRQEEQEVL